MVPEWFMEAFSVSFLKTDNSSSIFTGMWRTSSKVQLTLRLFLKTFPPISTYRLTCIIKMEPQFVRLQYLMLFWRMLQTLQNHLLSSLSSSGFKNPSKDSTALRQCAGLSVFSGFQNYSSLAFYIWYMWR